MTILTNRFLQKNFATYFLLVLLTCTTHTFASRGQPDTSDPFIGTDYIEAFDQRAVWKKHKKTIIEEGLSSLLETGNAEKAIKASSSKQLDLDLIADFLQKKKECAYLTIKNNAKGVAIYSLVMTSVLATAAALLPKEYIAMGAGFGGFVIAEETARTFNDAFKQYFRLKNYKGDPLLVYELKYAVQKRFIRKALWERIEARFLAARTNPYARQELIAFFEAIFSLPSAFNIPTLDATGHEPEVVVAEGGEKSASKSSKSKQMKILQTFTKTFDHYFQDVYDGGDRQINKIYSTFLTYLNANSSLDAPKNQDAGDDYSTPTERRPLFLQGPAGVGKTTVVRRLSEAFKIPVIEVNLSQANTPEDLFGNKNKRGLLLGQLLSSPYKNAILFFDEASTPFNNPAMSESCKSLFEADNGKFQSPYLESDIDMSRYMIIAAGNQPITDDALRSRFNIVDFPSFNKAYIKTYAETQMIPARLKNGTFITRLSDLSPQENIELNAVITSCPTIRKLANELPIFFDDLEIQRSRAASRPSTSSSSSMSSNLSAQ